MGRDKYLIISCDGGGIRGLATALLLQDLEKKVNGVLDRVDFFAGTSTGSFLALGLASGRKIDDLVAVYDCPENCHTFFTPCKGFLGSLLHPLYTSEGRQQIFDKYLPDIRLEEIWDLTGKRVLTTSFELNHKLERRKHHDVWVPVTINNLPMGSRQDVPDFLRNERHADFTLAQVAMCCTAAPLYYEAHEVGDLLFVDGGIWGNNPGLIALTSLKNSGVLNANDDVYLLALGTGFNFATYPIAKGLPKWFPWGLVGWMWPFNTETVGSFPVLQSIFDSSIQIDTFQCKLLLDDKYRRANFDLEDYISLDDCEAIDELKERTRAYMEGDGWQRTVMWVEENWGVSGP